MTAIKWILAGGVLIALAGLKRETDPDGAESWTIDFEGVAQKVGYVTGGANDLATSRAGIELIKRSEGFRAQVYTDAAGYPTIGYGHKLTAGESFRDGIGSQEAESLLRADLVTAEKAVNRLVRVQLDQGQFDALVSFVFNLGAGKLAGSTLLKLLNKGDYLGAAAEFSKWTLAGGRKLPGLVARRQAEAQLFTQQAVV